MARFLLAAVFAMCCLSYAASLIDRSNLTDVKINVKTPILNSLFGESATENQLVELGTSTQSPGQGRNGKSRVKRGTLSLYAMLGCVTDCNRGVLANYGNYCGSGGSGIPINAVDRCCQTHDACYDQISESYGVAAVGLYLTSYDWSCRYHGSAYCSRYQNSGQLWMCQCDLEFAECLKRVGCP